MRGKARLTIRILVSRCSIIIFNARNIELASPRPSIGSRTSVQGCRTCSRNIQQFPRRKCESSISLSLSLLNWSRYMHIGNPRGIPLIDNALEFFYLSLSTIFLLSFVSFKLFERADTVIAECLLYGKEEKLANGKSDLWRRWGYLKMAKNRERKRIVIVLLGDSLWNEFTKVLVKEFVKRKSVYEMDRCDVLWFIRAIVIRLHKVAQDFAKVMGRQQVYRQLFAPI